MAIVKKISELTPKGSALANTDLLIVGVDNGTDYDLKSITGAQVLGNVVSQTITDGATTTAPSENAVYDKFQTYQTLSTAQSSTAAVRFDKRFFHCSTGSNSELTGLTGNITVATSVPTYAGTTSFLIHNDTLTPTFSSEFIKSHDSLDYKINVDNYIICTLINQNPSKVSYRIVRDSNDLRLITTAEGVILSNTSGTNTGDETIITIKSKLGITTLSGSNTGDQDLSGLMVKSNNLSDLTNTTTARTNLGLGSLATQSGTFSGISSGTNTGDQTFLDARVQSVSSSATVTPTSTNDLVIITAQAVGLTLANPTGAFTEGQALMVRIKDNGTAKSIAFDTNYRAIGVTLPTTTVISKTMYLGIIYNSTDSKWDIVGYNIQA